MNCVSSTESLIISAAGASMMAKAGLDRLWDRLTGRPPEERRQAAWDSNAEFLAGLGHDPVVLLGHRPVVVGAATALRAPTIDAVGRGLAVA